MTVQSTLSRRHRWPRSYGFVHRVLSESGVTLRGRGGATRGKKAVSA